MKIISSEAWKFEKETLRTFVQENDIQGRASENPVKRPQNWANVIDINVSGLKNQNVVKLRENYL